LRARAIEVAQQHTNRTTLVSAAAGRFSELNTDSAVGPGYHIKPDDLVWAVTFSGEVEICPPGPADCVSRPGRATVFLDFVTGAFLATHVYSP
jgi:hypothetical protein